MDSAVTLIGVVLTGLFGVYIVVLQRQTHNEVKSPNGTKTGEKVYAVEQKTQEIQDRLVQHIADDAVALSKFTSLIEALRTDEAAAHVADQADRDQKALDAANAVPLGQNDLSSGGKTE